MSQFNFVVFLFSLSVVLKTNLALQLPSLQEKKGPGIKSLLDTTTFDESKTLVDSRVNFVVPSVM